MRLPKLRKRQPRTAEAQEAVNQAITAGAEANERLAHATEQRKKASALAQREQHTIIKELREMRKHNHLADLIIASVEHIEKKP